MCNGKLRQVLLLTMLLLAPSIWSAENDLPGQTDGIDQTATEPTTEEPATSPASAPEDANPTEPLGTELAVADEALATNETENPEVEVQSRFIPTEEISQDLGVSFPVDI